MKFLFLLTLLATTGILVIAQTPAPSPAPQEDHGYDTPTVGAQVTPKSFQNIYTRPTAKQRSKNYIKSMFGPVALVKTTVSAGYSTWRNSPEEWGPTWEGFGRRFASGIGKNVIKQTTIYGLGEAFKLDSAFYKSGKKNIGGRLGDALLSPFVARKTDGTKVFGFPRVAGTYTASIVAAETWYPKRFNYKDGLKSGTISLGLNAAFNVFKEFFRKK